MFPTALLGFGSGVWTAGDLKEFTWMLLYTGLRISDIVLFDMERLHGNEVFLRAKKNGGDVFTYIPDWLRDRLLGRAKRCGRKPFLISNAKNLDSIIETWREQLDKVFEMAISVRSGQRRSGSATRSRAVCCETASPWPTSLI